MGEIVSLLAGSVAASYDSHCLLAIEESVACGTCAHAQSVVFFLVVKTEIFRACSGGDNHRVCLNLVTAVGCKQVRSFGEVCLDDYSVAHVRVETLSLTAQVLHHLVAVDALRITGKVVDHGGLRELSSALQTAVHRRMQVGTSGVDGCGVSCRTAADDEAACVFSVCHYPKEVLLFVLICFLCFL